MNQSQQIIEALAAGVNLEDLDVGFFKALKKWIALPQQSFAKALGKLEDRAPPGFAKGGVFYRGMSLPEKAIKKMFDGGMIQTRQFTSWAVTEKSAADFAGIDSGFGVIFKKTIPSKSVLLNIVKLCELKVVDKALQQRGIDIPFRTVCSEGETLTKEIIDLGKKDIVMVIHKEGSRKRRFTPAQFSKLLQEN